MHHICMANFVSELHCELLFLILSYFMLLLFMHERLHMSFVSPFLPAQGDQARNTAWKIMYSHRVYNPSYYVVLCSERSENSVFCNAATELG